MLIVHTVYNFTSKSFFLASLVSWRGWTWESVTLGVKDWFICTPVHKVWELKNVTRNFFFLAYMSSWRVGGCGGNMERFNESFKML